LSLTGPCSDNPCHISAITTVCVNHESHLASITLQRLCEGDVMLDIDDPVSYFKIVFSVLTGFSVNFTPGKQAVGIYEAMHQSKGNMSTEVFDCVKIETDIVCNLQWSQNNGT
jgi:hypothetical protein